MDKVKPLHEVMTLLRDGQTIMIGGFLCAGTPELLIDAMIEKNIRELTVIANDTGFEDRGIGKLVVNKQIRKMIATHVGTNKETGRQMTAREMEVELIPQGTMAERIRAAGVGLGGILTPTGVGTVVEEGKEKLIIDGKEYLLELPLRAEIALLHAYKADKAGNLVYRRASRNFNPLMAMAADLVIVTAEHIVETGEIDPDEVMTPAPLVDIVVLINNE
ncbi:MAG: 3-oxoacid CoA-transferase subunit A [Oscillospiraceae bacterium]|nr:3-oxoacid CoA-transferase subunit A [Oscillospiraceae bacterium]